METNKEFKPNIVQKLLLRKREVSTERLDALYEKIKEKFSEQEAFTTEFQILKEWAYDDDLIQISQKVEQYKADKARTREYGGSGVGLSIVKAMMDAMNRPYGVCNYNNGVEFWFELEACMK